MDFFRKIVYDRKSSLNEFEINKEGSLNQIVYDEWLLTRKELHGEDSKILEVFNDAYFICTMAFLIPERKYRVSDAVKNIHVSSVVLPLARFYLSRINNLPKGTMRFWQSILSEMNDNSVLNYNELEEVTRKSNYSLSSETFAPRIITEELLSTISEVEWRNVTHNYRKDLIQFYVTAFAKNKEEWRFLINGIRAAAQKYDIEYGLEEYVDEGYDEDGPYTRTILVPRNPFDSDGNYILEPLKRAGVYQFCDKLMIQYDELTRATNNYHNEVCENGKAPKTIIRQINQDAQNIFHENLKPQSIVDCIHLIITRRGSDVTIREMLKAIYEVLKQISWLVDDKQTHFLLWAKANDIYKQKTMNFKNIKHNPNVDRAIILNEFVIQLTNGKIQDRDKFYRKNKQGDYLKKINTGE